SGIIHFSSKDRITRYDFGILVADIFNLEKTLIHETIMENMKWTARRPRDSSLNNEKAIKLFNNKPINVIDELKLAKEKMREQSI
ncbi:MAG: sugar nucleotide-binding protein, partial [Candidatus Micrarchaeaceae archaeon]